MIRLILYILIVLIEACFVLHSFRKIDDVTVGEALVVLGFASLVFIVPTIVICTWFFDNVGDKVLLKRTDKRIDKQTKRC